MWKWALSILLRGSEGLLGLFVTFLLVMQSNNVLDLLLNFSAMEFVTLLDDVIFSLTSEGFLGRVLKKEATRLSGTVSRSKYLNSFHLLDRLSNTHNVYYSLSSTIISHVRR